jgi:hypothetical protein
MITLHFAALGKSSFLAHSKGSELFLLSLSGKQSDSLGHSKTVFEPMLLVDFKSFSDIDKGLKIMSLISNRVKAS